MAPLHVATLTVKKSYLNMRSSLNYRDIHKVVEVFFQLDVPHNLLILRGDDFNGGRDPHQEEIRAILIPRKPFYGTHYSLPPSPSLPVKGDYYIY